MTVKTLFIGMDGATFTVLNDLIKPFANKAFWFMCGYCGIVGLKPTYGLNERRVSL